MEQQIKTWFISILLSNSEAPVCCSLKHKAISSFLPTSPERKQSNTVHWTLFKPHLICKFSNQDIITQDNNSESNRPTVSSYYLIISHSGPVSIKPRNTSCSFHLPLCFPLSLLCSTASPSSAFDLRAPQRSPNLI